MYSFFLFLFALISISLIVVILLQGNKSQTHFNSSVSNAISHSNMLGLKSNNSVVSKLTTLLAILFFVLSLILNNFNSKHFKHENSKWDNIDNLNISNTLENNSDVNDIPY